MWKRWHGGSGACTATSQQEGPGFDSRMGCRWGGRFSPGLRCSGGLSPGPFGVCTPVFTRVSSTKNPNIKTCRRSEEQIALLSVPDQRWTVHLTWSPGAYKLPTASGGSWRRDSPGWEKAEDKFTATSGLRVCVCPVSPPYIYVCVPVCRVCQ